jgi:ketosteroid isomerase-like protein
LACEIPKSEDAFCLVRLIGKSAMKNSGSLEDQMLIREAYGLYAAARCQRDVEAWIELWTDDAQWNSHVFNRRGKDEVRQLWRAVGR